MIPNETASHIKTAPHCRVSPELSALVILKNVWYEIEKLQNAPSWQLTTGHSAETLAKYLWLSCKDHPVNYKQAC